MMTSSKILLTSAIHCEISKNAILMTSAKFYDVSNVDTCIKKLVFTYPNKINILCGVKDALMLIYSSNFPKFYYRHEMMTSSRKNGRHYGKKIFTKIKLYKF